MKIRDKISLIVISHGWHDSWNCRVVMNIRTKSRDLKIAVSSREASSGAQIYEQFGRTYWFMIYSMENDCWWALDNNENRTRKRGAGVVTTQILLSHGVNTVLTGETGPKVFRMLTTAGVVVVHNVSGVVEDALCDWLNGCLDPATEANDAGSPNCLMSTHQEGWRDRYN